MTLLDRKLLIVGGKGGVGKSVVASALALLSARQGKRTLLVGIDDPDRFSSLLGADSGKSPGKSPGKSSEESSEESHTIRQIDGSLHSVILKPKVVAREFVEMHLPLKALANKIFESGVFHYWFDATPMLSELLMLGKIWRLVTEVPRGKTEPEWDMIVVESPATGHGLGFLQASDNAAQLLVGPMRSKAEEITEMLRDGMVTSLVVATLAEDMPVSEALELEKQARDVLGMTAGPAIVNAVFPNWLGDDHDQDAVKFSVQDVDEAEQARLNGALKQASHYVKERCSMNQKYLEMLKSQTRMKVWTLPWITSGNFGRPQIELLANELESQIESAAR